MTTVGIHHAVSVFKVSQSFEGFEVLELTVRTEDGSETTICLYSAKPLVIIEEQA